MATYKRRRGRPGANSNRATLWDVMNLPQTRIVVGPPLTPDELFGFYKRNNICEVRLGRDVVARILEHPHVIVAAFADRELIGLARAT